VLVAKADSQISVELASQVLGNIFEGVPQTDFQKKQSLLQEMLNEVKNTQIAHPSN